jgi:O-antigen ligase
MSLTSAAFLIAFFTGLGFGVFKHPRFALYTYVAVFYLHPPSRWWGDFLPDLRWSLLAAVVALLAAWRLPVTPGRTHWLKTTPGLGLLLFTIWLWIQSFWALDPTEHREACILFSKFVLLYYLIYRLVDSPEEMGRFLLVHFAGCAYLGVLAYFEGGSSRLEGVGGPGIDEANAFAMQMGTAAITGAVMSLAFTDWRRYFAIVGLPLILNAIILSGSRGGFLALVVAGLVLWMFKAQAHRKLFYVYAVLGLMLFGMLAGQIFWDRMGTMKAAIGPEEEQQLDTSAESRFVIAEAQMAMARDHPFGSGHRGTAVLSPMYLEDKYLSDPKAGAGQRRRSSHNTFLSAYSEQGWPGAIWFVVMIGWSISAALRLRRVTNAPEDTYRRALLGNVIGVLAGILVAGIFVDYLKAEVQIWFWAFLASMLAQQQLRAAQRARPQGVDEPAAPRLPRPM